MNIYKKLANIQQKLKVAKNQENKFAGFKYRSCEDILEAVKPILTEEEVLLNISDEIVLVGDRFYIQAIVKILDYEGNFVESKAYARESLEKPKMDSSQVTGSASSYARKYALNGLLCIDDTKDPDFYDNSKKPQQQIQLINDTQVAEIMRGCVLHKKNVDDILKNYKVDNLNKLNINQYNAITKRFKELEQEFRGGNK